MTIGIVGAGQLGRMMALAGYPLGFDFLFLDKDAATPGGQVAPLLAGEFTDRKLLGELSERCEVLTFDWENIPVEALEALPGKARIAPPLRALGAAQDRLERKTHASSCSAFRPRNTPRWIRAPRSTLAVKSIGLPGVLKTRRLGYDGKGQFVLAHICRSRRRVERARQGTAAVRKPRAVRRGSFHHRGARRRWRGGVLSTQSQRASRRHSAPDARAVWQRGAHPPGTARGAQAARAFQLCRRAHHRILRARGPPHRQRDGAARAQLGALDHRGRGHQPVRESRAGHRGSAARQHRARAATRR